MNGIDKIINVSFLLLVFILNSKIGKFKYKKFIFFLVFWILCFDLK